MTPALAQLIALLAKAAMRPKLPDPPEQSKTARP